MEPILYKILRPIIKFLFNTIYRPTYIGLDNIKSNCSLVLAGNHTNNLDCLLLISSTKRPIHFLAKDSLAKGIKKYLFLGMGIIPVNRKTHDKKALNSAIDSLNDGKVIGIFPEGTINKTKDIIMPFKIGAVKMAHDTNSYIVPFTIKNKYKIFKKSITIEFYKPYKIDKNIKDLSSENKKLMKIISTKLEER